MPFQRTTPAAAGRETGRCQVSSAGFVTTFEASRLMSADLYPTEVIMRFLPPVEVPPRESGLYPARGGVARRGRVGAAGNVHALEIR
jgi:hypothetical protein